MNYNIYASVSDYKLFATGRGQTANTSTDDDAVIGDLLEGASRYIDEQTARHFFPVVETRYYSVPNNSGDDRRLWLDDDLLEIIAITNGDSSSVAASSYNLEPRNYSPRFAIRLKDSSSVGWEADGDGNLEYVIAVNAIWGYHNEYARRAWVTGSTLNEGGQLTASDLTWTMTSVSAFAISQIVRIENELAIISSVSGSTIVVDTRGENGSTAATHDDGTAVTFWRPMSTIRDATLAITHRAYANRTGQASSGSVTVTGAGVVIRPEDVPAKAQKTIDSLMRMA